MTYGKFHCPADTKKKRRTYRWVGAAAEALGRGGSAGRRNILWGERDDFLGEIRGQYFQTFRLFRGRQIADKPHDFIFDGVDGRRRLIWKKGDCQLGKELAEGAQRHVPDFTTAADVIGYLALRQTGLSGQFELVSRAHTGILQRIKNCLVRHCRIPGWVVFYFYSTSYHGK